MARGTLSFLFFFCLTCIMPCSSRVPSNNTRHLSEETNPQRNGPKCERVDWLVHQHALNATNNVIQWAMENPMVEFIRNKFQGLHFYNRDDNIEDMRIDGVVYKRKSAVVDVDIPDARSIKLLPIIPLSNSALRFRAYSNATVRTHVKFVMSYQKKKYRVPLLGYKHCPFEWQIWGECPTTTVEINAIVDITSAYYEMDADLFVYKCGGNFFQQVACNFQSVWQYGAALIQNNFPDELLKRVDHAKVVSVTTDFEYGDMNVTSKYVRTRDTIYLQDIEKDARVTVSKWISRGWLRQVFFGGLNRQIRNMINGWLKDNEHKLLGQCAR